MRTLTWIFLATAATTSLVSCVKTNAFRCDGDSSVCTGDGARCETDGFCSVSSARCTTGQEYSDTAGDLAGTCVGGEPTPDGPTPDGPQGDGPPSDGPPSGCNAGFVALAAGGNPNHKYKLITVAADWLTQQNTVCVTANSYLAIPDDAGELGGLFGLAVAADLWVGVSDRITEGEYREVLNNTIYASLPISEGGGNQNGQDCIATANGTTLDTEDCNGNRVAVCECEE